MRLEKVTRSLKQQPEGLTKIGYSGASTGAAAALKAAADLARDVGAVVSCGGRPDLAGNALGRIEAPTLLTVGGLDDTVIQLNREAYRMMRGIKELKIVPDATHLLEEPGTLEEVARAWLLPGLKNTLRLHLGQYRRFQSLIRKSQDQVVRSVKGSPVQ